MEKRTPHILTLRVDNEFGVLTRITSQIRREGWNIKSLAVAESLDPAVSRITLSLECFDTTLPTVLQRLSRLACVQSITAFDEQTYICRELMIVRIPSAEASLLMERFGANAISQEEDYTILELSGVPAQLDALAQVLEKKEGVLMTRTGPITLER